MSCFATSYTAWSAEKDLKAYPAWSTAEEDHLPPTPHLDVFSESLKQEDYCNLSDSSVPAWESDPAEWNYEVAEKVAEQLLQLGVGDLDPLGQSEVGLVSEGACNPRFKTEFCRNFREKGVCLYGDMCQFAHGKGELRQDIVRHSKYKTKLCQKYWIAGYCAYGPRCNFIHDTYSAEPIPAQTGGLRPFIVNGNFRKNSESSIDSGIETGFFIKPGGLVNPPKLKSPDLHLEDNMNQTSELNRNHLQCSERNMYGTELIRKGRECLGAELRRSTHQNIPHPENNPIPAPIGTKGWTNYPRLESGVWCNGF